MLNSAFWSGRRVFLTGHTGFKGAWLALWLQRVGARVTAYSLQPPTQPNLFDLAQVAEDLDSRQGDIRDFAALAAALNDSQASVVFHLAAQATVAEGYRSPRDTYATNLNGTLNLLDAMRDCPTVQAAVIVTSDKCYAPSPNGSALAEDAPMGYVLVDDPRPGEEIYDGRFEPRTRLGFGRSDTTVYDPVGAFTIRRFGE